MGYFFWFIISSLYFHAQGVFAKSKFLSLLPFYWCLPSPPPPPPPPPTHTRTSPTSPTSPILHFLLRATFKSPPPRNLLSSPHSPIMLILLLQVLLPLPLATRLMSSSDGKEWRYPTGKSKCPRTNVFIRWGYPTGKSMTPHDCAPFENQPQWSLPTTILYPDVDLVQLLAYHKSPFFFANTFFFKFHW